MAKYILVLAMLSLSLALSVELHAQSLDGTVVFIKCSGGSGGKPSYGSGVLVSGDGKVLTAKHVIPEGRGAYCEGEIGLADNRRTRSMDIRRKHSTYDAALLQFPPLPGEEPYEYLKYCRLNNTLKRETIIATGFPGFTGERARVPSSREGILSTVYLDDQGMMETDALTTRGMSGGMVTLGDSASLIGIIAGVNTDPTTGGVEYFGVLAAQEVANEFGLEEETRLCSSGLMPDESSGSQPPSRSQKTAPEKKPTGLVAFDQSIEDKLVYIECADQGKQGKRTRGSGVLVSSEGHVLTAKHVVPDGFQCYGVVGTAGQNPTQKLLRSPLGSHIEVDAALLQFIPKPGEVFPFVRYSKLMRNFKKEAIDLWGFPDGGTGEASLRSGSISTTTIDENGFFTTTGLSGSGMSGGPVVLRKNGCLIGIVGGAKFDLKTAVPMSYKVLAVDLVGHAFQLIEATTCQ